MKCHTCDGSGKLTLHKGWIVKSTDDFYSARCGICGGTGESNHRAHAYETEQRKMREQRASFATPPAAAKQTNKEGR